MIDAGLPMVGIGTGGKDTGTFTLSGIGKAAGFGTVRNTVIVIVKGHRKTLYFPAEKLFQIIFVCF